MEQSFSVFDILETSWDITRKNFLVIMGYSVVAFVTLAIVQFASMYLMGMNNALITVVAYFVILIINSFATLGFYKLTFLLIDSEEEEDFSFSSIVPSWKNIFSFMSLTILLGLIVATFSLIYEQLLKIGSFEDFVELVKANPVYLEFFAVIAFILLMLATLRFMFFPCFIVDDDSLAFESLRQSKTLTQDNLLKILAVLAMVIGFIALGFLAFGVGIVITYPFVNVILVVTYRRLVNAYITAHPDEQFL